MWQIHVSVLGKVGVEVEVGIGGGHDLAHLDQRAIGKNPDMTGNLLYFVEVTFLNHPFDK